MKKERSKTVQAAAMILVIILILIGCAGLKRPERKQYEIRYDDYFDTITTITLYLDSDEQFKQIKEWIDSEFERYHQLYDIYHNYPGVNNIKTINDNAGIVPVVVDRDIIRLLKFSVDQYEATDGKVNIAMGSVLDIWHQYRNDKTGTGYNFGVPDMVQLMQADEYTDIDQIRIDEAKATVFLPNVNMKLDVGSTAKGYAVQRISEGLAARGITSALISAGGNVKTIGVRGDGSVWRVGIQDPDITSDRGYLHAVRMQDMALVTSGSYQRFYEVDGVRYHHIINPDTLMPWNEYVSVTILCRDSGQADALSTAMFNTPVEAGLALIESMPDTEALWVYPDGREVASSGFQNYIDD